MKKNAFTMLELVFVIVVVAILAAAILPRMDRDTIYEASEQVLGHIKYTQHLAMVDNLYDDTLQNWHRARWQIQFANCANGDDYYLIGSDANLNGIVDANETALDPLTSDAIYDDGTCVHNSGWHNDVLITDKYSVTVALTGNCNNNMIAFDHLGRPYRALAAGNMTANLLKADCIVTLTDSSGNQAAITITPETGYSYITYLP